MRPRGSPEALEQRRMGAMALLRQGLAPGEVARRVGVDRRSVRRWRAAHDREGPAGLVAKPAPGRPSKLDDRQKQQLTRLLSGGARAFGYPTDLWTYRTVRDVIRKRYGIRYHVAHLSRLLPSMGWNSLNSKRSGRQGESHRPLE